MGRFWHIVLLLSQLVYAANCDNAIAGEDALSSTVDTTLDADTASNEIPYPKKSLFDERIFSRSIPGNMSSSPASGRQKSPSVTVIKSSAVSTDYGIINLTKPMFTLPYDNFQIQVFNASANRSLLFYAPAVTLLPNASSISVNAATNASCLSVSFKLWDESYIAAVRDYISKHVPSAGGANSKVVPLPFKHMLVGYYTNGFSRTMKKTPWKIIDHRDPTASACIRCPTDAACNEMLTALQSDSATFASRLFVSFAISYRFLQSALICIDTKHLPNNPIVNAFSKRFATGRNYIFMQPSDYANFTKTLVATAIEKVLGEDDFVVDAIMDRLVREISDAFPFNTTTTGNFTTEMWAATYWENERPDKKAHRLERIFGTNRTWVRQKMFADYGNSTNPALTSALNQAYDELIRSDKEMYWSDDKVILKSMPVYRVNLDFLHQNAPVCKWPFAMVNSTADYTVVASVGRAVPDAGP
ncbi:uncharacterized protein LOC129582655 [Paramacrobiotus metropolitanus]|uniref:uncharacterized protein LOC129582655 n=1 Tax=Paramacrobiotus metropolitanus TaxID=2943436 RepID=UPI0024457CEB|nr:uncharacterized protein LOC129582655 [Paramacrobiotus metropolitanus]